MYLKLFVIWPESTFDQLIYVPHKTIASVNYFFKKIPEKFYTEFVIRNAEFGIPAESLTNSVLTEYKIPYVTESARLRNYIKFTKFRSLISAELKNSIKFRRNLFLRDSAGNSTRNPIQKIPQTVRIGLQILGNFPKSGPSHILLNKTKQLNGKWWADYDVYYSECFILIMK